MNVNCTVISLNLNSFVSRSPSSTGDTRFPKLDECAHFHYENVELGPIKVSIIKRTILSIFFILKIWYLFLKKIIFSRKDSTCSI